MRHLLQNPEIVGSGWVLLAMALAVLAHWVTFDLLRRVRGEDLRAVFRWFARRCWWPARVLLVAIAADAALTGPGRAAPASAAIRHGVVLALIGALAWLVVRLTYVAEDLIVHRFDMTSRDNLLARKVHTQAMVLRRVVTVVVAIVAVAIMLFTFSEVRVLGASILASAGIAGLVVGFAAQSTLANLMAGIQIALAEPIRLDDVVVVEGEWARIEEITFTYVVVRIWDERRLVLPISYFAKNPFENWTRTQAAILGTVHLYVDYTVPVDEVRRELERVVETSPQWDRRVAVLQVTGATDRAVVLRALVSAADSSAAWDLRCQVRERLIEFLRARHPGSLPRTRAELVPDGRLPGLAGRRGVSEGTTS